MTVNTLVLNGMRQYRCTGEGLCRIGDSFSTPGNLPGFLPLKFLEFFRNSLPTRFYAVKFTDGRNTGKRVDNPYILLSVPFLYSQFFLFNLFLLICPPPLFFCCTKQTQLTPQNCFIGLAINLNGGDKRIALFYCTTFTFIIDV